MRSPEGVVDTTLSVSAAAALDPAAVLDRLGTTRAGLSAHDVLRRRAETGVNAIRSHRARFLPLLARQVRSPILVLLAVAAVVSFGVGERADAVIIGVILAASVGIGVVNEYGAERAAQALHSRITHRCVVWRDGHPVQDDVIGLVPGDVVEVRMGEVAPADLRLLATSGLEMDESVLTGESMAVGKSAEAVAPGSLSSSRRTLLRRPSRSGSGSSRCCSSGSPVS